MTITVSPTDIDAQCKLNVFQRIIRVPMEIVEVAFQCNSGHVPVVAASIIDVLKNGQTIFRVQPQIDYGKFDSKDSVSQPELLEKPTMLAPHDLLQIDLVQIAGGRGYAVDIFYRKPAEIELPLPDNCVHNDDFSSVTWHGTSYTFNEIQAILVRKLWSEWQRGVKWVSKSTLLDEIAESHTIASERIRDIFKSGNEIHSAWNNMIVPESKPNRKGLFGLSQKK